MDFIDIETAVDRLKTARRIMVFGCSGSGKSTLAQKLTARFDLRYVSMDRDVLWLPGWQLRSDDQQEALMQRFIAENKWVFDGTGPRTMPARLARAELAIWMRP